MKPQDNGKHKKRHAKFLELQLKFGKDYVMTRPQQEAIKQEGHKLSRNEELSLPLRIAGAEMCFKGWFSRSVQAYGIKHPSFRDYVAMLLKHEEPSEVYDALKEQYGVQDGMFEGSSYFGAKESWLG